MSNNQKSLYRTYRPSTFNDVAGHTNVVEILKKQLMENKISHALLFTGQRGTGKTSIARIFAKSVNCENLLDGITCEECNSCINSNSNQSPDITEIDAASNNGVDEIRNIKNNVSTLPILGKYKIYIIDEVHMLTKAAFNALLKTLEEPPVHALFILATTEYSKLPATIISRCQTFNFKKIDKDSLKKRIDFITQKEGYSINEQVLNEIYFLSEGSLRDALNILEQLMLVSEKEITIEALKNIFYIATKEEKIQVIKNVLNGESDEVISYFEKADSQGMDFDVFSLSLIEIIKEIIEFSLTKNGEHLKNISKTEAGLFDGVKIDDLFLLADNLSEAYAKTKGTSINFNYLLINLLKSIGNYKLELKDFTSIKNNVDIIEPVIGSVSESQTIVEPIDQNVINEEPILSEVIEEENPEDIENVEVDQTIVQLEQETIEPEVKLFEKEQTSVFAIDDSFQVPLDSISEEEFETDETTIEETTVEPEFKMTESELIEILTQESVKARSLESYSVSINEIMNVLVAPEKTKRELIEKAINDIFKTDAGYLIDPLSAKEMFPLFNVKVPAVSKNMILIVTNSIGSAKLINSKLTLKVFKEELFKQLGGEYIVYAFDNNKWDDTKKEYMTLKANNSLPTQIVVDTQNYYKKVLDAKLVSSENSKFLNKVADMFDFDINIGD
ncbi:DNA polymerase III subunit gamma/tau [Mesoplasma photuris]|uniref:DNA polymerase III subunit gamma/tau n=1 Tax=Mesoplasma photuris TaxID=217731 RepID=UPI0004E1F480|nr:DNA polymerase III subunit gamma/tau [Mesoplasma photuris]